MDLFLTVNVKCGALDLRLLLAEGINGLFLYEVIYEKATP